MRQLETVVLTFKCHNDVSILIKANTIVLKLEVIHTCDL